MEYSSQRNRLVATGTRIPYGITQCYLPPGSMTFLSLPQQCLCFCLHARFHARFMSATLVDWVRQLAWCVCLCSNNKFQTWLLLTWYRHTGSLWLFRSTATFVVTDQIYGLTRRNVDKVIGTTASKGFLPYVTLHTKFIKRHYTESVVSVNKM